MTFRQVSYIGLLLLTNCFGCCENPRKTNEKHECVTPTPLRPVSVNIYVENSGSMTGYCNVSDKSAIETLIRDYYDRLNESADVDNISLNFINTSIVNSKQDINGFINSIKRNCTAQYTKLDQMFEMMMDSVKTDCVNILISDYVFTSNDGNLAIAASGITSLFSKQLRSKDLAVAIYKYMVNFKGKYYPGGLNCNKPLPLYVWVFGNKENVRKITLLPFNSPNCGIYFMQKACDVDFDLIAKSKRMIKDDIIRVSEWQKDRHGDYYEFSFTTKLDKVLLTKNNILEKSNYRIQTNNSTKYVIANIEEYDKGDETYKFTIKTNGTNPAPGQLTIYYPIVTPEWVAASNFEGNGVPADSTTYGVSYLINGVSKAFENTSKNNNNYFTININLE